MQILYTLRIDIEIQPIELDISLIKLCDAAGSNVEGWRWHVANGIHLQFALKRNLALIIWKHYYDQTNHFILNQVENTTWFIILFSIIEHGGQIKTCVDIICPKEFCFANDLLNLPYIYKIRLHFMNANKINFRKILKVLPTIQKGIFYKPNEIEISILRYIVTCYRVLYILIKIYIVG